MISEKLITDMTAAMKSGDKMRLGVIRMLRAELKNAEIAAGGTLSENQEQKVLASYAKKRKEAGEQCRQLGRGDLAEKEDLEYSITMSYLPRQIDEAELSSIIRQKIDEVGARGAQDMGKVMKAVREAVGNRADGAEVAALVKKALGG
jgi:uncharacterized protein YqeY